MNNQLTHYGILGMKWGVRRYQNKDGTLTSAGKKRYSDFDYAQESSKTIKTNADGSKTIPKGFIFNRVGQSTLDVNKSGALYVSYGKEDAARYVKNLGPTPIGKILGEYGTTIQHISVKNSMKMPSDKTTAEGFAKILKGNKDLLDNFNNSLYVYSVTGSFDKKVSLADIDNALKNPLGKEGQKLAYGLSSFLGNANYSEEAKAIYKYFRDQGYDALPDIYDRLSGTSNTAMIVINPDKIEISSTTEISKDVMSAGKKYVKTLEKLKVSDLLDL